MEDEKRMKKVKHGKKQVITVNIYIVFSNRQVKTVAKGIMLNPAANFCLTSVLLSLAHCNGSLPLCLTSGVREFS